MSVQDDARENVMVYLFNLDQEKDRKRHEADAFLIHCNKKFWFELKSTTTGSLSTVRDFGRAHIEKWSDMHWIIGFFKADAKRPEYCHYLTPDDMKEWTDRQWAYVEVDYGIGDLAADRLTLADVFGLIGSKNRYSLADARKVQKQQYSAAEYREKADLPGGVSEEQMARLRAPFVGEDWFDREVGIKQLYSAADLDKLLAYQGSAEKVAEAISPEVRVTDANASKVFPALFLDDWIVSLKEKPITPMVAARKLSSIAAKARRKQCLDVESGYSPAAMLRIVQDRCRYLVDRGSTLNNPHIKPQFFEKFERITTEHAKVLRAKLDEYIRTKGLDNVEGADNLNGS